MLTYAPPSINLSGILSIQLVANPIQADPPRINDDGMGGYIARFNEAPAMAFLHRTLAVRIVMRIIFT
jgi:hypothetical protein